MLPADRPLKPDQVNARQERSVQRVLARSVEKKLEPKPLALRQGTGWMVQLTDAALVGKPPEAGSYKVLRSGIAALDDRLMLVATLELDDPASADVDAAMALVASVRLERGAVAKAPPRTPGPSTSRSRRPASR